MIEQAPHIVIFSMWYYPSHFGMHVDDVCDHFEKLGLTTTVVTVVPDTFLHTYFDPVRHMFLTDWQDREGTIRLPVHKFINRGPLMPLLVFDRADPHIKQLNLSLASRPNIFFHFFEQFAPEFNSARFPNVTKSSLYYAGNFVSRILVGYGLAATPACIDLCLDANLAHLYTGSVASPSLNGIGFIVSQTHSLANMIQSSHLRTPVHQINRPFDLEGVLAAPAQNIRTALGLSLETRVLAYAGRPTKNAMVLPELLKVVRAFARDSFDIHLVLIGTQNYDISTWKWYPEQRDHIHTFDFLPRRVLYGLLKTCDVLTYPSVIDGHSKIISESQAAGLAIVAFDAFAAGTNELIESNRTGVLIPEGDINAFARAVYTLLRNVDERMRLSDEALRTLKQTQDVEGFARSYLNLCEQTPTPPIQVE